MRKELAFVRLPRERAPSFRVARDAAELLASERVEYVRAYASKTCG